MLIQFHLRFQAFPALRHGSGRRGGDGSIESPGSDFFIRGFDVVNIIWLQSTKLLVDISGYIIFYMDFIKWILLEWIYYVTLTWSISMFMSYFIDIWYMIYMTLLIRYIYIWYMVTILLVDWNRVMISDLYYIFLWLMIWYVHVIYHISYEPTWLWLILDL